MPQFFTLPMDEAIRRAEEASLSETLTRYCAYVANLADGHAGCLTPDDGEDVRTVRLRLSAAARKLGKKVVIRRSGDQVLFWVKEAA